MNAPILYTDPSQSETTVVILNDIQQLESHLENMPEVKAAEEAELVSEYRTQLRKRAKELDQERLNMTKPFRDGVTNLNQKYNVHIERAERAAKLADNLLMPYMKEQARQREEAERAAREQREAEERARREAEEAEREAERIAKESTDAEALQEAESKVSSARAALNELGTRTSKQVVPPKSVTGALGSTTGLRKVWKYRVVDISRVPEEYLLPPEERVRKGELNKIAKSQQETASVPGIEFYAEDILSSAAARKV